MTASFSSRQLSLIVVFSALSHRKFPIGHLANYFKTIPLLPLGMGQILAGLHLIMIVVTALYVKKPGAATMTGAVKARAHPIFPKKTVSS
jgi:ABC-type thiamin/hydroxymethylpyrimidine transport system permease subunit